MQNRKITKQLLLLICTISACRITDYGCVIDDEDDITTIDDALYYVAQKPYTTDARIRTPEETAANGGDCEDKACLLANILEEQFGLPCEIWIVQSWQVFYTDDDGEKKQMYHALVYDTDNDIIYEPTSGHEYKTTFALQVIAHYDYEGWLWYAVNGKMPLIYDRQYP